jgi:hypothetical protein
VRSLFVLIQPSLELQVERPFWCEVDAGEDTTQDRRERTMSVHGVLISTRQSVPHLLARFNGALLF